MKTLLLQVDFEKSIQYRPTTFVKGDTNSCQIKAITKQDITEKLLAVSFRQTGQDSIVIDMETTDPHTATLTLPTDVLSVEGRVDCQVAMYAEDFRLTNSADFYYMVSEDLADEAVSEVEDRVPILTSLINDVLDIKNNWRPDFYIVEGDLIMEVQE